MNKVLIAVFAVCLLTFPVKRAEAEQQTEARKADYHEGILNKHGFGTSVSIAWPIEDTYPDLGGEYIQSFGFSLKVHPKVSWGLSGGYSTNTKYKNDPKDYGFGTGVVFNFRPDEIVDPYISVGLDWFRQRVGLFGRTYKDDSIGISTDIGFEIKPNRFVSIMPEIGYSYRNSSNSASFINLGLGLPFRFSDNEESSWSKAWLVPFVNIGIGIDDNALNGMAVGISTTGTF